MFQTTKYELREYQKQAVERGVAAISSWKMPTIIVLPTWSWKSLVIAWIVSQLEWKTLIFQPSKEILEQNYEKFRMYSDETNVWIFSASVGEKVIAKIVFATIWSVANKMEFFKDYKNIIIDECHFVNAKGGQYEQFINYVWTSHILWLTATPYRLSTTMRWSMLRFITRTRPNIFKNVCHYSQIQDLKEMWFMANLKYYQIKWFDSSKIRSNSTGAEFSESSIKAYYREIAFDNSLLDVVKRLVNAERKNILVFTQFTNESKMLVESLGDIAAIVTAETKKKERERILKDFKEWKIKVVANVWVLTTGFDFPELETVVLARATKSLALYYQMVGRWIRPHKEKEECRIVDMCENVKRFWHVEDLKIHDWWNWKYYIATHWKPLTNVIL